jgi:predicted secreted protein
MFDVSHKGLESAIKACREICKRLPETCVMILRQNKETETVWSLKVSNNEFAGRC